MARKGKETKRQEKALGATDAWLKALGAKIRQLREGRGLSREDVAKELARHGEKTVSTTTLMHIESGKPAYIRTYLLLAEAFGLSPSSFLFVPDPLARKAGIRTFEEGIQTYGYFAKTRRLEVRLDPDGGAFVVHTIEDLQSDWYEGAVCANQQAVAGTESGAFSQVEYPFEIISRPADLPLNYSCYLKKDGELETACIHRIELPQGLGGHKISYRWSFATTDHFQRFAEIPLIPEHKRVVERHRLPSGRKIEIAPANMQAIVAPAVRRYGRLSEKGKKRFQANYVSIGSGDFPAEKLVLTIRFPKDLRPDLFEPRCSLSAVPWPDSKADLTEQYLPEGAPFFTFMYDEVPGQLRLEIEKPVMKLGYGIMWWPPPFASWWPVYERYLKEVLGVKRRKNPRRT